MSAWIDLLKDLDDEVKKLTYYKNQCLTLMNTTLAVAVENPDKEHGAKAADETVLTFESIDQELTDLKAVIDRLRTILSETQSACQPRSGLGRWWNTPRFQTPPWELLKSANENLGEKSDEIDQGFEDLKKSVTKPVTDRLDSFKSLARRIMLLDLAVEYVLAARISIAQIYHT